MSRESCLESLPHFTFTISAPIYSPAFAVALLSVFYRIRQRFQAAARDTKRLEGTSRTPVYRAFAEVLGGLETIRAFGGATSERFRLQQRRRSAQPPVLCGGAACTGARYYVNNNNNKLVLRPFQKYWNRSNRPPECSQLEPFVW